jgi:excisionase family DNA binding protein
MRDATKEEIVKLEPLAVRYRTAAGLLECSESTVRKLVREGKLTTRLVGCDERILVESIKAWAAGRPPV